MLVVPVGIDIKTGVVLKLKVSHITFLIYTIRAHCKLPHGQLLSLLTKRFPDSASNTNKLTPLNIQKVKEYMPYCNQKDKWENDEGKIGFVLGMSECLGPVGLQNGESAVKIVEEMKSKYPKHEWVKGLTPPGCVEWAIELYGSCQKRFAHCYRATDTVPLKVLTAYAKGIESGDASELRALSTQFTLDDVLYVLLKWDPMFHKIWIRGMRIEQILTRAMIMDVERGLGGLPKQVSASLNVKWANV